MSWFLGASKRIGKSGLPIGVGKRLRLVVGLGTVGFLLYLAFYVPYPVHAVLDSGYIIIGATVLVLWAAWRAWRYYSSRPALLPPSRTRRIAKWTGLVVCVVIVAMWAVSTCLRVVWQSSHLHVVWSFGRFLFMWQAWPPYKPRWIVTRQSFDSVFDWPNVWTLPRVGISIAIDAPFWFLLTLAAIPTAFLWHRDRRTVKPGCCLTCGYDLRASKKVCPECGTAIATAKTPSTAP